MDHLIIGGIGLTLLFIIMVVLLASVFWIWMLVDAAISRNLTDNEKILWVIIIFFTHFIGALIYFFVGRRARAF